MEQSPKGPGQVQRKAHGTLQLPWFCRNQPQRASLRHFGGGGDSEPLKATQNPRSLQGLQACRTSEKE